MTSLKFKSLLLPSSGGKEGLWRRRKDIDLNIFTRGHNSDCCSKQIQIQPKCKIPPGGGQVEEFAKLLVSGACKGNAYVKHPSWHDIFLLYRVLVPDVLGWMFHLLFATMQGSTHKGSISGMMTRPPILESPPPRKALPAPQAFASVSARRME